MGMPTQLLHHMSFEQVIAELNLAKTIPKFCEQRLQRKAMATGADGNVGADLFSHMGKQSPYVLGLQRPYTQPPKNTASTSHLERTNVWIKNCDVFPLNPLSLLHPDGVIAPGLP